MDDSEINDEWLELLTDPDVLKIKRRGQVLVPDFQGVRHSKRKTKVCWGLAMELDCNRGPICFGNRQCLRPWARGSF